MKKSVKNISLFLAVFFVLGVGISFILEAEAMAKHKNNKSDSDFEEFKASLVKCSDTTMLCGLDPTSPLLGTDSLITTEGSRARIKKHGRLEVRVEGVAPSKTYDVLLVFTPGGSVDCSSFDPSTCTADCTDPNNPVVTCGFEPANCSADCTDPNNPVITCNLDPANCTTALTLLPIGSFTTDSKGKGKFEQDVSGIFATTGVDSVHVLITDHDTDITVIGDVPRQFITGAKIR